MLVLHISISKQPSTTQKQLRVASKGAPYVIARRLLDALLAVCRSAVEPGQRVLHVSSQSRSRIPLTGTYFASGCLCASEAFLSSL